MLNPTQPDVLDRMIARLEEANARSYKEPSRADETSSRPDDDDRHQSPDQPAQSKRRSSRATPWFVAVVLLLVAALVLVTGFAGNPQYLDEVKSTLVRWVHASVLQTRRETPLQAGDVPAQSGPPEIEQRLQKMADELADLHLRVEQIKTSQDQILASGAKTAAQLKIDQKQMMSDAASIGEQLKATQEQLKATQAQLTEIVSSKSAGSSRKLFRRKRVAPLSLGPRAQSSVR